MNFILKNCCNGTEKRNKGEGNSHLFNVMSVTVAAAHLGLSYFGLFCARLCTSTAQVSVSWTNRTSSGRN